MKIHDHIEVSKAEFVACSGLVFQSVINLERKGMIFRKVRFSNKRFDTAYRIGRDDQIQFYGSRIFNLIRLNDREMIWGDHK